MGEKKKFSMLNCVLTVICVVFVAEAAAPVAAIGNSQYFWWIFMIILFLLPYGLISSEMGTTYDNGGGLYDWVSAAYGHRMGARVSWYYWINFPLWTASLAVMFPGLYTTVTGKELNTVLSILLDLALVRCEPGKPCDRRRDFRRGGDRKKRHGEPDHIFQPSAVV